MARYFIYEGNFDRLKTLMARIEKKCAKYDLHFKFEEVGHEYREIKQDDGSVITAKFIEIEVEGLMRHENWEFIAKVDHFTEGNIIRQFKTNIEVPNRYRHTDSFCEHCKSHRRRNFTYLVHNVETDEWKQVGSSCLKEFTSGLDAEAVAKYISFFDKIIEGETSLLYSGMRYVRYYKLDTFLQYVKATVDIFGYVSRAAAEDSYEVTTRDRAWVYYKMWEYNDFEGVWEKEIHDAQDRGFDANKPEIKKYVEEALTWVRNLTEEEMKNDSYLFNLHIACSEDYFEYRNVGFIVSLMPTYYRHLKNLEYEAKKKAEADLNPSRYQGEIGKRIEFKPVSISCVCSNDSIYGPSFLYKILDKDGNVYMWSTGNYIECDKEFQTVRGTVKSHSEYRGVQQTFLTRCKVA